MFERKKANKHGSSEAQRQTQPQVEPALSPKTTMTNPGGNAVIGSGIKINGEITGNENLVIKGTVEGKINLPGNEVEVETSAKVNADIIGNLVRISGTVKGDVTGVEKIIITKDGKVNGNLLAPRVSLEDGAKFKGSIDMEPKNIVAKELPLKNHDKVKAVATDTVQKEVGIGIKNR